MFLGKLELIANLIGNSLFIKVKHRRAPILAGVMFLLLIVCAIYIYRWNASNQTKVEMEELVGIIKSYHISNKQYPSSLQVIISIKPTYSKFKKDYWGNNYIYNKDRKTLTSKGMDEILGTTDDIILKIH